MSTYSASDFFNENSFKKLQKTFSESFESSAKSAAIFEDSLKSLQGFYEKNIKTLEKLTRSQKELAANFELNGRATAAEVSAMSAMVQKKAELIKQIDSLEKKQNLLKENTEKLAKSKKDLTEAMKKAKEATEKLKEKVEQPVDSSSIKGLKLEVKALTAEFENLSEEERDNIEIGGKLKSEIEEISQKIKESKKIAAEPQSDYFDDLRENLSKLESDYAKFVDSNQQASKEAQALKNEIDALNGAIESKGEYESASQKLAKLRKAYKDLAIAGQTGSMAAQEMKREIDDLDASIKAVDESVGQFQRSVGDYRGAIADSFGLGNIMEAFTTGGVAGAAAAGLEAGISLAVESVNKLVENLEKAKKQLRETETLTGLLGEKAQEVAAGADALANSYEQEFSMVLMAQNRLMKDFGATGAEAFDLINRGLAQAGSEGDEFLESIREYGPNFRNMGISAANMVGFLSTSVQNGAYQIDKAGDIINNAFIELTRINPKDLSKFLQGKDLKDATKIISDYQKGVKTGGDAVQLITAKILEMGITSRSGGELLTKMFTAVGEEGVSVELLKRIETMNSSYKALYENLTNAEKAKIRVTAATKETSEAMISLASAFNSGDGSMTVFFEKIKTYGLNYLEYLVRYFQDLYDRLVSVYDAIFDGSPEMDGLLKSLSEIIIYVKNAVVSFLEFQNIFNHVTVAVEGLYVLFSGVQAVLDGLSRRLNESVESFRGFLGVSSETNNELSYLGKSVNVISAYFDKLSVIILDILNPAIEWAKELWSELAEYMASVSIFKDFISGTKEAQSTLDKLYNSKKKARQEQAKENEKQAEIESKKAKKDAENRAQDELKEIAKTEAQKRHDQEKAASELQKSRLQRISALNSELMRNEKTGFDKRISAASVYFEAQNQLEKMSVKDAISNLDFKKNQDLKQTGLTAKSRMFIEKEYLLNLERIQEESKNKLLDLEKEKTYYIEQETIKRNKIEFDAEQEKVKYRKEALKRMRQDSIENEKKIAENELQMRLESLNRESEKLNKEVDNEDLSTKKRIKKAAELGKVKENIALFSLENDRKASELTLQEDLKKYDKERVMAKGNADVLASIDQAEAERKRLFESETAKIEIKYLDEIDQARNDYFEKSKELRLEDRKLLVESIGGGLLAAYEASQNDRINAIKDEKTQQRELILLKVKMLALDLLLQKIANPKANLKNSAVQGVGSIIGSLGSGFYEGGYTPSTPIFTDKNGRSATSFVHANEFVVSEKALKAPQIAPIIAKIDNFQKNGTWNDPQHRPVESFDYSKLGAVIAENIPKTSISEALNFISLQERSKNGTKTLKFAKSW